MIIRNQSTASRTTRKGKKLSLRAVTAYAGIFVLVISFLAMSYQTSGAASRDETVSSTQTTPTATSGAQKVSVDQLTAAYAAANLADSVNLPAAGELREATTTLSIQKQLAQTDTEVITKPQIIQPDTSAQRGLTSYVTKQGDTIEAIAKRFRISARTLRWANNMLSDAVEPGKTLTVPTVDGVVYTVKDGDTIEAIASKYKVDAERVVLFNDLDRHAALTKDTRLVLPNGDLPETERPGYIAPRPVNRYASAPVAGRSWGSMAGSVIRKQYGFPGPSAGNRYAWGNCTWYVFERRAQLGRPIGGLWGDARMWAYSASRAGFTINRTPAPGAIMQTSAGGGGYGHVAVVEQIEGDQMLISDMNYAGNNVVTWRKIPLANASSYNFIH